MAERRIDRRTQRTQRSLRQALIAMVIERAWDDITVQQLCERADVGRSTFYTHFADKEDVLLSGFDELRTHLRANHATSGTTFGFVGDLLVHALDHRRLFKAIVGKRSGHAVQKRFRALLFDLIREDLHALVPSARLEPVAHYISGALAELMMWWFDHRTPCSSSELLELFHELTTPLVGVARGRSSTGRGRSSIPAK